MNSIIKIPAFLLLSSLFFTACNSGKSDSTSNSDTTVATVKPLPADTVNAPANPDQASVNYAVTKNTKEVAWLQAGRVKGTSKELKEHAKMMLADHKKLDGEVSALVAKKGWTAPTVDVSNEVNINDKSGKDWDMAWTDKMIADHSEILDMFGKAKQNVKDDELRTLITKTIPVVQSHLDMAKAMKAKMK